MLKATASVKATKRSATTKVKRKSCSLRGRFVAPSPRGEPAVSLGGVATIPARSDPKPAACGRGTERSDSPSRRVPHACRLFASAREPLTFQPSNASVTAWSLARWQAD